MPRRHRFTRWILATLVACPIISCGDAAVQHDQTSDERRPFIVQLDSIALEEVDDFYVGEAYGVSQDQVGRLYVSDGYSGSVLQFKRSGAALRRFGRKGKGPGELLGPAATLALGDSLLVVADNINRKLVLYDLNGGALVRELKQVGIVTSIDTVSGGLILGRIDAITGTSAARWQFDKDTIEAFGPLPAEYLAAPLLASIHSHSVVVSADSGIVVGMSGSGKLFRLVPGRTSWDSIIPPSLWRRGVPENIVELYKRPASLEEKALWNSALMRAGVLADGSLGLIHMDYQLNGTAVTARAFLSALRWKDKTACVDREVKMVGHSRPAIGMSGGTFIVLEQVVTGGTRPVTTVRYFAPEFRLCRDYAIAVKPIT
jgi:hypothetical protein